MADDSGKDDKVKTEAETQSSDFDLELGDLSQFIDTDESTSSPELGDLDKLESDFSGDLSLLDEAIAELESESSMESAASTPDSPQAPATEASPDSALSDLSLMEEDQLQQETEVDQSSAIADDISSPAADTAASTSELALSELDANTTSADDENVPVLEDAVAEVSHTGETTLLSAAADTVPTLDESAVIADSAVSSDIEATDDSLSGLDSSLEANINTDADSGPLSDDDAIGELESIAEQLLEEEQAASGNENASLSNLDEELSLLDSEISASQQDNADPGSQMEAETMVESMVESPSRNTGGSQFNESAFDAAMSSIVEDAAPVAAAAVAATSTTSAAGSRFASELQAHLAQKIEALVMEAIASFSDDLNNQLAMQIQEMIIRAIDNALPSIMETMANSLKGEVETQVKSELPEIIDKMLGDISFAE